MPPKPGYAMQQLNLRQFIAQRERKLGRRDHAARDKDGQRDRLAADVEAYLARGREIEVLPSGTRPLSLLPARSAERSW